MAGQPVEGRFNPAWIEDAADGRDDINLVGTADTQWVGDVAFDGGTPSARAEVRGRGRPVIR
jgi:hypothetical protein